MILSGHEVFKMVDTFGLPLEIIVLELKDRNAAFNVAEFIESASKAKWKKERVYNMILFSGTMKDNEEFKEKLTIFVEHYYKKNES